MISKLLKQTAALSLALGLASVPATARETQTVPNGTGKFMNNVGEIGGRSRVFFTYVPNSLKPGAPLLIMFHGGGGDGAMARLGTGGVYDHLADRDGFLVVYPSGIGRSWNTCRKAQSNVARRWEVDDLGFVEAIIEQSVRSYGIDRKRVFVTGDRKSVVQGTSADVGGRRRR